MPLKTTDDYVSHVQKGFTFKTGKPHLVGFDPAPKDPVKTIRWKLPGGCQTTSARTSCPSENVTYGRSRSALRAR